MSSFRPRTDLFTHEVTNQPEPLGDTNVLTNDAMLTGHVLAALSQAGPTARVAQFEHLTAFGETVGQEAIRDLGRQANENPPKLHTFDRFGQRIDEVEFHPAYHALMKTGLQAGVAARAWTHPDGGHVAHAALMILMGWADAGVCCPMSMTYAVAPALRAAQWSAEEWTPRILACAYDPRALPANEKHGCTMGMAMTEKQGGSDVRANTTQAHRLTEEEVELVGHKWFCSAPMSDAFLTLAYEAAGLSCFLVPRWRPDGVRNPMEIQRLKDKLGDRSNASSEIEYRGAWAKRVGEPGRGVRTIIEMVQHTRLDCLVGSAGQIRMALALAAHHVQRRSAFQKRLLDQPAMRAVLADLALEAEAALALAFRTAALFDLAARADELAQAACRIVTPIAKFWICKRAPGAVYEAMECLGGAGYVEESGLPRLFRQSPLNAIWEGSGNVIALDILRALAREPHARDALASELAPACGMDTSLDSLIQALLTGPPIDEANARNFASNAALALEVSALVRAGEEAIAHAFLAQRVGQMPGLYGACGPPREADRLVSRAALAV